ncbi:MAG: UvrB/UvrC motif-containing protein, partial [Planctomycetes bacterium]|nr:UvrB/UvrC motif-containing protein [Planctomycetota bacterium]
TQRRRKIQLEYNKKHNIKPETIKKEIRKGLLEQVKARDTAQKAVKLNNNEYEKVEMVGQLEKEMFQAAEMLDFERATALRDKLKELKDLPQLSNFKKDKIKKKVRKK